MNIRSATARCPVCDKQTNAAYRPFCSKRCADIDLGRWLKGGYAIPGEVEQPDDEPAEPESRDEGKAG